jgi:hypothetical protein
MAPVKVFREGKGTFSEWRFENGQSLGSILNQGEGVFLENEFSSLEEAKAFCEKELGKDASLIFNVMQGKDIIGYVLNDAYQIAKEKKEDRIYAAVSMVVVILLASGVSVFIMPFESMLYHLLFVSGMGGFYFLLYLIGAHWNLESVVAIIILLILISVSVPLLIK